VLSLAPVLDLPEGEGQPTKLTSLPEQASFTITVKDQSDNAIKTISRASSNELADTVVVWLTADELANARTAIVAIDTDGNGSFDDLEDLLGAGVISDEASTTLYVAPMRHRSETALEDSEPALQVRRAASGGGGDGVNININWEPPKHLCQINEYACKQGCYSLRNCNYDASTCDYSGQLRRYVCVCRNRNGIQRHTCTGNDAEWVWFWE
jgi:hypothetical protein